MAYSRSEPLQRWLGPRAEVLGVVTRAHAEAGELTGPGRPLDVSKPLAHAFVVTAVAEFQGFTRDLHDLTAERLINGAGIPSHLVPLITEGLTRGRQIDRGNADLRAIKSDFARLGLSPMDLARHNSSWASRDSSELPLLFSLRNAVAHGNQRELRDLRAAGTLDTVTWVRGRLPVLNRMARSMDHLVWDHLHGTLGTDPWRR